MIYHYTYLYSKISKAQSFVNYIILEILCKANKLGMPVNFDSQAVIDKYKDLVDQTNPKYIVEPINNAYQICKTLSSKDIKVLRKAIHSNINIKGICERRVVPVLFSDIKDIDKNLANHLYIFCRSLYKEVIKLKPFTVLYGTIKEHYDEFSVTNGFKSKRCPFCGSTRMENHYTTKREAYDHYFPKEQYPFISIDFWNLVPMCYKCNSLYKSRKNPIDIEGTGVLKKVFFPFHDYGKISCSVEVHNVQLDALIPNEIDIANSLSGYDEEIETWESLFEIQSRYKAIYVADAFNWFEEIRIATNNFGVTYSEYKKNLDKNYFINENFLKVSLFEACEKRGMMTN